MLTNVIDLDFLETISKHVDENDGKGGGNKKGNRKKKKGKSFTKASPCQVVLNYIDRLKHTLQQNIALQVRLIYLY